MTIDIGSRRELFVDHYLIDRLDGAFLALHEPRDEGTVLCYDKPWEGVYSNAGSVMKVDDEFRLYYRAMPSIKDGTSGESTCLALSDDGLEWRRPNLGLFELHGTKENNAILAQQPPFSHNFMPLLDERPGVAEDERFKAVAGIHETGLCMFVSADGLSWRRMMDEPGLTSEEFAFDSPNLAFWSDAEQCYVCYFRTWRDRVRWVSRSTSDDFVHWGPAEEMEFWHAGAPAPVEHIYTTGTHPYFRAPHIYVAMPRRFMASRRVLSEEEAERLEIDPSQRACCSDSIFMTSRGGSRYDRTFMQAFVRPGPDRCNWSSRPGTIAAGVVQTGPREMSLLRNGHYGRHTNHVRRWSMRLDGFASVRAPYAGGELVTKPFSFSGSQLSINYDTSAAGSLRVEVQDSDGQPIAGYALDDAQEIVGDEMERVVSWQAGTDVGPLQRKPIRLRFVMNDADVYSLQFQPR